VINGYQLPFLITLQAGHNMGQQNMNGQGIRAKAKEPSRYDGSLGSDPTVWLFQFAQYADITNEPAARRPRLASTYLDGKAATWWMGLVAQTAECRWESSNMADVQRRIDSHVQAGQC
jgi:hypothetical protein